MTIIDSESNTDICTHGVNTKAGTCDRCSHERAILYPMTAPASPQQSEADRIFNSIPHHHPDAIGELCLSELHTYAKTLESAFYDRVRVIGMQLNDKLALESTITRLQEQTAKAGMDLEEAERGVELRRRKEIGDYFSAHTFCPLKDIKKHTDNLIRLSSATRPHPPTGGK